MTSPNAAERFRCPPLCGGGAGTTTARNIGETSGGTARNGFGTGLEPVLPEPLPEPVRTHHEACGCSSDCCPYLGAEEDPDA